MRQRHQHTDGKEHLDKVVPYPGTEYPELSGRRDGVEVVRVKIYESSRVKHHDEDSKAVDAYLLPAGRKDLKGFFLLHYVLLLIHHLNSKRSNL